MLNLSSQTQVYLAVGNTDMRKSSNTLSILVEEHMDKNPFSGHLYVFCNRKRNIIKILYWDRNGFCLWQKRLEKDQYHWPFTEEDVIAIGEQELRWILDGLEVNTIIRDAHTTLEYSTVL